MDGTDALPEQLAPQRRNRAQSTMLANAHAERFVRSVREECLDWLLIAGRRHLDRVLYQYIEYYNRERPHRGLDLSPPQPNAKTRASPTSPATDSADSRTSTTAPRREGGPNPVLTPFTRSSRRAFDGRPGDHI